MDTDGELEERLEMDTVTEGTSDDEIVSEDNDGEPRIHTPTLDFAGGKLDAYKLGRIISFIHAEVGCKSTDNRSALGASPSQHCTSSSRRTRSGCGCS